MEKANQLFQESLAVNRKYNQIYKRTGKFFNIFSVLGVESDEVKICKIIAELLNPKGNHYQGSKYLRLFIDNVLIQEDRFEPTYFENFDYENSEILREVSFNNNDGENGRIDIVITDKIHYIPIEVKIYAGNQDNQCYRYYEFAKKKDKETKVCFLTLKDFNENDENIVNTLSNKTRTKKLQNKEHYISITFDGDIIPWLMECVSDFETLSISPIREVVLQLIDVLYNLTGGKRGEKEMEISEIIGKTSENYKAAIAIEDAMKLAKTQLLYKIMDEFETALSPIMKAKKYEIYPKRNISAYDNYYYTKSKNIPGIAYKCKEFKNFDIWFCVEVGWRLYCGYYFVEHEGEFNAEILTPITKKKIEEILPNSFVDFDKKSCMVAYCYLPNGNKENSPDFYHANSDDYIDLFDEVKRKKFIKIRFLILRKLWRSN